MRTLTYPFIGSRYSRGKRIESAACPSNLYSFGQLSVSNRRMSTEGEYPLTDLWASCAQLLLCASCNARRSSIDAGSSPMSLHTMVAQQAVAISFVGRRVTGSTRLFFSLPARLIHSVLVHAKACAARSAVPESPPFGARLRRLQGPPRPHNR